MFDTYLYIQEPISKQPYFLGVCYFSSNYGINRCQGQEKKKKILGMFTL